jgi:ABC-type sugar transport system permease subunit
MNNDQTEEILRKVVSRAAWRLNLIEIVVLILAIMLSLLAGYLTALMLSEIMGISHRSFWTVASLLFFCVPGFFVVLKKSSIKSKTQELKSNGEE